MDALHPKFERRPGIAAKIGVELNRLIVLAALVGLVAFAIKHYWFDRLDEQIRAHVEARIRSQYPSLNVAIRSARRVPGRGLEIRGLRIADPGHGDAPPLIEIDEILAQCDTRLPDFLTKPPAINALYIGRIKLRAERTSSGSWNLAHLGPLPNCQSAAPPSAHIRDGTIEILDPTQGPNCSWMLRNVELTLESKVESPGTHQEPTAVMAPAAAQVLHFHGTLAGDNVERIELGGTYNPHTNRWEIRGAVQGLEFNPRLKAALPHELSSSLGPLSSVRGRTYFGFHAESEKTSAAFPGSESSGFPFQFVVHGKIQEGRIDDARLPEPLTDVEATIRCDPYGILIQDLPARCGRTQLELDAALSGYGGHGPIDIELTARQLQLERLPLTTLPQPVRETWDRFHPLGLADVTGRLKFDGRSWQPNLTIECHDLTVVYDRFPYRLTDGSGTILVKPDSAFVRLRMNGGGQIVNCRADVQRPGPDFTGWIEVQSEGPIPIDDKLLAALDSQMQGVVRSFQPRGAALFQARFQRDANRGPLRRQLQIDLKDCSIRHDKFPYPIDKVEGQLELTEGGWQFRNLSGRNDSASIVGEGAWRDAPGAERQLVLQFTATDVPLADELRYALSAGPQQLWSRARPRGNIDQVSVGLKYLAQAKEWSIEVAARKWPPAAMNEGRTVSLEPAAFPYRFDNVTGNFYYSNGKIQFENFQAVHGRASITAVGSCQTLSDGSHRLSLTRLNADRLDIDQELLAAMPPAVGHSLSRFPLSGPVNLTGEMAILIPAASDASSQLDWKLSVDVENGRILTPTPVEHMHGGVRLVGRQGPEGIFGRGELNLDSAMIRGVQVTNLQGPFWFDGKRLVYGSLATRDSESGPRRLSAQVFDGALSLDGEIALGADSAFQLEALLEGADLKEIANQVTPHQRGLSGNVFGAVRMSGAGAGMHTWRGNGQIRLRDADIYELPVMISLLKILSIQRPDLTAFTTGNIDFRIEGDELALARIDLSGDAISLKGTGRMTAGGEIDLQFYPIVGREERQLAIIRPILGETAREFMLIEARGPLNDPDVRRTVFPRLDPLFQQLFPELVKEDSSGSVLPIIPSPRDALERLRLLPKR